MSLTFELPVSIKPNHAKRRENMSVQATPHVFVILYCGRVWRFARFGKEHEEFKILIRQSSRFWRLYTLALGGTKWSRRGNQSITPSWRQA
jgi:hypothetical protein